jgi:hypothetical protein
MEMEEEYNEWHAVADQTASTGVMRVVCMACFSSFHHEQKE